jgi:hypothetical protein
VLFRTDLSLIPAGITGNTKYFPRISAWLGSQLPQPQPGTLDLRSLISRKSSVTQLRQPPAPGGTTQLTDAQAWLLLHVRGGGEQVQLRASCSSTHHNNGSIHPPTSPNHYSERGAVEEEGQDSYPVWPSFVLWGQWQCCAEVRDTAPCCSTLTALGLRPWSVISPPLAFLSLK